MVNNIKDLRNEHKITQTKLSELIGVTQSAIAKYESGENEPSIEVLIKIAKALNVTTDELLGIQTKKETSTEEVEVLGTDQRAIQKLAKKLDDAQASQVYNYMLFVIDQKNQKLQNFDF